MPLITWISEVFPESQGPFTVAEITIRLQQFYSLEITLDSVYRAFRSLEKRPAMAALVAPIDDVRPAYYSHESARRIARHLTHSVPPPAHLEPVILSDRARLAINPNSSQIESSFDANEADLSLAA
jgi:hypothetical protein